MVGDEVILGRFRDSPSSRLTRRHSLHSPRWTCSSCRNRSSSCQDVYPRLKKRWCPRLVEGLPTCYTVAQLCHNKAILTAPFAIFSLSGRPSTRIWRPSTNLPFRKWNGNVWDFQFSICTLHQNFINFTNFLTSKVREGKFMKSSSTASWNLMKWSSWNLQTSWSFTRKFMNFRSSPVPPMKLKDYYYSCPSETQCIRGV